ncbi:MAG: TIGR04283 family arsenosugar biosynthesis glycosyltransferase [Proteobacteria bacterium]|nr:TIGR04283 family arsenosugar biosynthesis glycosyltransferase [Pseudomonadota bacterium]
MRLSVVIPAIDEAATIDACLDRVAAQPGVFECIVADGGSADDTVARVRQHRGVRVIEAEPGRGRQLNAGAGLASGDTLLFLHVDTELPVHASATIDRILHRPGVVAGGFRTWHVADKWRGTARAALLHLADLRSRYSSVLYGDQAMFMRHATFVRAGGFPEIALMEDIALSKKLAKLGRIEIARRSVRVSGRRFEAAPVTQTVLVNVFPLLYAAGVSPNVLARLYGRPR